MTNIIKSKKKKRNKCTERNQTFEFSIIPYIISYIILITMSQFIYIKIKLIN